MAYEDLIMKKVPPPRGVGRKNIPPAPPKSRVEIPREEITEAELLVNSTLRSQPQILGPLDFFNNSISLNWPVLKPKHLNL